MQHHCCTRELLPHDFTLASHRSTFGGMFLLHFPSPDNHSSEAFPLGSRLFYVARTFLHLTIADETAADQSAVQRYETVRSAAVPNAQERRAGSIQRLIAVLRDKPGTADWVPSNTHCYCPPRFITTPKLIPTVLNGRYHLMSSSGAPSLGGDEVKVSSSR